MKKLLRAALALMLILSLGIAAAAEEENLLQNGDFSQLSGELPEHWRKDMWLSDAGVSLLYADEDGYEGGCVTVVNVDANDARFSQTVDVEPDSIYRLSGMIRATDCDTDGYGANLSVEDVFVYTDALFETYGGWKYVELYGRTGPDQTELTVFGRVGGYGTLSRGAASFDNLSLVRVDEAPDTVFVYDLFREPAEAAPSEDGDEAPARATETWLLFICVYVVVVLALYRKRGREAAAPRSVWPSAVFACVLLLIPACWLIVLGVRLLGASSLSGAAGWLSLLAACVAVAAMAAVLVLAHRFSGREPEAVERFRLRAILFNGFAIALFLRLFIAVRVPGYGVDINCFTGWSERMFAVGPAKFYAPDYFCDYPPGYMLLLWLVGALRRLLNLSTGSGPYLALLKLMPMLADIAGAALLWRVARRRVSERAAIALGLLMAFNPAAIANSAAWGQIDALLALALALCALEAVDGRWFRALVWFGAALLLKPQALLFGPVGLCAAICAVVRAEREDRGRLLRQLAGGVAACLGLLYAAAFLCSFSQAEGFIGHLTRPVAWLVELYSGTVQGYRYLTVNALNLYYPLGLNWARASLNPFYYDVAWALFIAAIALCVVLTAIGTKRPRRLFLTGGLLIVLICCFGPMIHERYIFPGLILLALAYASERDRRLLVSLVALTATLFLNEVLVLQGGIVDASYGHLQSSEHWLNCIVSLVNVVNAGFLAWTAVDICAHDRVWMTRTPKREEIPSGARTLAEAPNYRMGLKRRDALLMAAVTLVYSAVAFTNLGVTKAPQSGWVSSRAEEAVVFDLGDVQTWRMTYYGGICNTTFTVELSNDGEIWTEPCWAKYNQGEIFRWLWFVPMDHDGTTLYRTTLPTKDGSAWVTYAGGGENYPMQTARYVRITAESAGLTLYEVAFLDEDGAPLPVSGVSQSGQNPESATSAALLIDEQSAVAPVPSYLNSTYFDEIYHARTAYEHLHGMTAYEWTHPPLGKVTMMLGIKLFGMTPFGWRFMGALTGVLMVPLMYLLVKQLTKDTRLSFIAMCLMALDSMHFTQTRIATIDSYAVFWIMLMYLFMFRYCQMSWNRETLARTLVPLGLCGVTMGIAWATKWVGIYASAGLAVLFFWTLWHRLREARHLRDRGQTVLNLVTTLLFCVLFFIIIPAIIYYLSYYWQLRPEGVSRLSDMFSSNWLNRVIELQKSIFNYHAGLGGDTHYFRSPWYQWPVIWWPMWYYSGTGYMPDGMISSISCMGNPAVWWFGLAALIFVILRMAWLRRAPRRYVMVVIAFASQFLPWVIVPRSTFIYHYFASVPFIIIASVLLLDWIRSRSPQGFAAASGLLLGTALVLFVGFYPLESGLPCSKEYAKYLRWFRWYNY